MHSTTGSSSLVLADVTVDTPEQRGPDETRLREGLTVLLDFVRHVRLPQDVAQEQHALLAVESLHRKHSLSNRCVSARDELSRYFELADDSKVGRLIDWVEEVPGRLPGLRHLRQRRRQRLLLLFVLLAKTVAPEEKFAALRALSKRRLYGHRARLDRLLASVRPLVPTPETSRLGVSYLKLAGEVLFDDDGSVRSRNEVTAQQFLTWTWPRQVLHLLAWRSASLRENPDCNAALSAGTVEFQVARAGAFTRIARRGGVVARRVLRDLDYRDYRMPRGHRSVAWIVAVGIMLVLITVSISTARSSLRRWNDSNKALAMAAIEHAGIPVSTVAPGVIEDSASHEIDTGPRQGDNSR